MIGVAVGLGNVWRFPYMMGKYGGSAFLFCYLAFSILFAFPALMAEIGLGRQSRQGPYGAFKQAFGTKAGKFIGILLLITILIASSYYVAVIANVVYSSFFSLSQGFSAESFPAYQAGLNNGVLQYSIVIGILAISLLVIFKGLKKGIEWVSKLFVPFFLVVILYLIFSAFSLEGAKAQFLAFLRPDFAALKPAQVFAALGQSFYSLSLGGTFMLIYGSYLKDDAPIPRIAFFTGLGDVGAALLTSLFIVPTILVFSLDMTAGPQLIFNTLPHLFEQMPGGQLVGSLFLIALSMVAFLSLVGAFEVLAGSVGDLKLPWLTRNRFILIIGILEALLALPSTLYPNLIGVLDLIFGSGMQVLGSGLAVIGLTWGLGRLISLKQIFLTERPWHRFFYFWLRWIIPLVLLSVLLGYIYDSI